MKSELSMNGDGWEPLKLGKRKVGLLNRQAKTARLLHKRADFVRKYNAYGSNVEVIQQLIDAGVETVEVDERDGQGHRRFTMPLQLWLDEAVEDVLNERDGKQFFLPVEKMGKPVILQGATCDRWWSHDCVKRRSDGRPAGCGERAGHILSSKLHTCRCGDRMVEPRRP